MPATMPGRISGRVTVTNTQNGLAPSVAGGVFEPAVDRLDRQADRAHHQRKAHHRAGERRAGPAEGEDDAEALGEEAAERPAPAEQQQQQIAGDDRRHDQRQVHERVEQRLAPEAAARQQQRDGDADRQARTASPRTRPAATGGSRSISSGEKADSSARHRVAVEHGEALLLEQRAAPRAAQIGGEGGGVRVGRRGGQRDRIDDRRMAVGRERCRRS